MGGTRPAKLRRRNSHEATCGPAPQNYDDVLAHAARYSYCYTVSFSRRLFKVRFGMLFETVTGVELVGQVSDDESGGIDIVEPDEVIDVRFEFENRLLPGTYFGNAGVSAANDDGHEYAHRVLDAIMFRVRLF